MSFIVVFFAVMWLCVYHLICASLECERKPQLPQRTPHCQSNQWPSRVGRRSLCIIVARLVCQLLKKKKKCLNEIILISLHFIFYIISILTMETFDDSTLWATHKWQSLVLKEPSDVQTEEADDSRLQSLLWLYPVLFKSLKDSLKPWNFTCWLMAIQLKDVSPDPSDPPSVPTIKLLVSIGATLPTRV